MHLKVERIELLNGLTKVQTVVEKKSTMPIISNVLLEASEKQLNLIATDLEVALKITVPAHVDEPGNITVSARKLYEIIREIPNPEIELAETEGSRIRILSGKIVYNLIGLPAEQFPALPVHEDMKEMAIDSESLLELINKTIFSVSLEDTRFNLTGINIERVEDKLRMVSSDGHRLSLMELTVPGVNKLDLDSAVLLPRKGAREILKLCENQKEIRIGFKEKLCMARSEGIKILTRLIDGEFPDYKEIISTGVGREAVADRRSLLETLRRTAILATDKYKAVSLNFDEDKLELISVNPDLGDAKEELELEYKGEAFSINFNMHYLIHVLEVVRSEKVILQMENESSPCIIRGNEDQGFLGIVMPMRI
ncbi:MAG: DNA polymerase III subunit beta [Pseudomonadota bacterium]